MPVATSVPLLNRELSRLDYNRRVLAKAEDPSVPLLERLRFLTFCSRNLDEFFMVRVGATRDLIEAGIADRSPDGLTPAQQLDAIRDRVRTLLADVYRCLGELLPQLVEKGIVIESFRDLAPAEQEQLTAHFHRSVAPVLTPLAIDPGHPFPFVANLSLTIAAVVESQRSGSHAILMKIPPLLQRFVALPGGKRFVPIGSLIVAHLGTFFPSMEVKRAVLFRVIRNTELSLDDSEILDLRESVEAELRRRERKQVVCLEIDERADDELVQLLAQGTRARMEDVYRVAGFLKISDLAEVYDREPDASLTYREFTPRLPQRLATSDDIFSIVRAGDVLLHRPYESFTAVIELVHAAATDPDVIVIKQTLYQTDEHSPVVDKLVLAALNGKQVSVVIELQVRFEESKNIAWAKRMQDAGVQVVYGLLGVQTHAKMLLVVRKEGTDLRRYVHLSTGNYNVDTARVYTDFDLLTANEAIGREASQVINVLTGYSATSLTEAMEGTTDRPRWEHFILAPFDYHRWLLAQIEREAQHAREGRPARIVAKLNSLVDAAVIAALYAASEAGVQIDLIVRATCSLLPINDRIRVMSIVDRFLEHSRIIRFENGGKPQIFLSSGDWMPRNFLRRVELTFPLLDANVRARVENILTLTMQDNASSWDLRPDGSWERRKPGKRTVVSSQESFIVIARTEAVGIASYEEAIAKPEKRRKKKRR